VRTGPRIGVDVGTVRVGVAVSDRDGLLATPVATLARDADADADLRQLADLVLEREAVELVVGLPRSLSGAEGAAAQAARSYAERLAALVQPVPVRLVDERLSTVTAHQQLRRSGVRERQGRAVVDQAAAVVILQQALDTERSTGRAPGELVFPAG
jgi:putative pre-16S rRNA nuclease